MTLEYNLCWLLLGFVLPLLRHWQKHSLFLCSQAPFLDIIVLRFQSSTLCIVSYSFFLWKAVGFISKSWGVPQGPIFGSVPINYAWSIPTDSTLPRSVSEPKLNVFMNEICFSVFDSCSSSFKMKQDFCDSSFEVSKMWFGPILGTFMQRVEPYFLVPLLVKRLLTNGKPHRSKRVEGKR